MVQQFHRGDLAIIREEVWSPISDGQATATIKLRDPRGARDTDRQRRARPRGSGIGSRLEFHATVEVNIPLVGGKIENFIGSQLVDLLIAEQRFTTVWISENA